jgi:hypothetical protein
MPSARSLWGVYHKPAPRREAATVGSVALLKAELDRLGIMSKRREGARGALSGGKRFSRGARSI